MRFQAVQYPSKVRLESRKCGFKPYNTCAKYGWNQGNAVSSRTIPVQSTAGIKEMRFQAVQYPCKVRLESRKCDFKPYNTRAKYGWNQGNAISSRTIPVQSTAGIKEMQFQAVQYPCKVRLESRKCDFKPYNTCAKYGWNQGNAISSRTIPVQSTAGIKEMRFQAVQSCLECDL